MSNLGALLLVKSQNTNKPITKQSINRALPDVMVGIDLGVQPHHLTDE